MNELNTAMADFVGSGLAIDVVLAVLLVELIILWRGAWRFLDALLLLLPAALILIALRAAIADAHWIWIVAPLAMSFPAHLADLKRRTHKKNERGTR